MRLPTRTSVFALVISAAAAAPARAQVTETPVPFDSASRVTVVTETLAERLKLAAPAWPVTGAFREARLYAVLPSGGYILVVPRPAGSIDRFPLTEAERTRLRDVIDAAMSATGRPSNETGSDLVSEPAGNAFARSQTFLAALVYGPLAASLAEDNGSASGALYLAVTGGTFFASYAAAQNGHITRAQNHLGSHLGLAGGTVGWLVGYSMAGNSDKGVRTASLGGAIAGTIVGVGLGRPLSDAEAHGATTGVEATGLLTLAATGALGGTDRGLTAATAAGLVAGYPIGLAYPRRAAYKVTAGDADAVSTAGLVGALYGGALLGKDPGRKAGFAVAGATYLAGLVAGDALIARNYDLTESESNMAGVGAFAGALVGLALPAAAQSDEPAFLFGSAAVGATLGMAAMVSLSPHWVGGSSAPKTGPGEGRNARLKVDFGPAAVLGALSRVPGRYSLVHIGF